jgi:hypothetical protein
MGMAIVWVLYVAVIVLSLAGMWKAFVKAGQPGWAGIVPIYNIYVLTLMAKKPVLWVILCLVPCVNIVIMILLFMEIAKLFGKEPIFGVGLALLGFIFWPILGFGDAKYQGEAVNVSMPQIPGSTPPPPPPAAPK